MLKAYKKPFTRNVEGGTFKGNHNDIIFNSKRECHQLQIVRTNTTVVQGEELTSTQELGSGTREGDKPGPGEREADSTEASPA